MLSIHSVYQKLPPSSLVPNPNLPARGRPPECGLVPEPTSDLKPPAAATVSRIPTGAPTPASIGPYSTIVLHRYIALHSTILASIYRAIFYHCAMGYDTTSRCSPAGLANHGVSRGASHHVAVTAIVIVIVITIKYY